MGGEGRGWPHGVTQDDPEAAAQPIPVLGAAPSTLLQTLLSARAQPAEGPTEGLQTVIGRSPKRPVSTSLAFLELTGFLVFLLVSLTDK